MYIKRFKSNSSHGRVKLKLTNISIFTEEHFQSGDQKSNIINIKERLATLQELKTDIAVNF